MKTLEFVCLLLFVLLSGCGDDKVQSTTRAKNVILMIGDGMGDEHIKAARWKAVGFDGHLAMDSLPYHGSVKTHSANNLVTDSAAAATAMATGVKTNNGVVGLNENLEVVETILELAQREGKSVGLITTTDITHATPASFATHVTSRNNKLEIASQFIDRNIDLIIGGGESFFLDRQLEGCFGSGSRDDGRNLIEEAKSIGYTYICDARSMIEVDLYSESKILALLGGDELVRPYFPSLKVLTAKALEFLSKNPNGFFLMVEGGQIDWASHSNDALNAIDDTILFDDAVKVALEFEQQNKETILLVTADHETGGLLTYRTPTGGESELGPFVTPQGESFYVSWSTNGHTAKDVTIFASGVDSAEIEGTLDNTDIFEIMLAAQRIH